MNSASIGCAAVSIWRAGFVLGFCLLLFADGGASAADPPVDAAVLQGRSLFVKSAGIKLELPVEWVAQRSLDKNVHVTAEQLESVRTADGEWDHEYAEIVNSVLSFNRCVAHAGSEGWGKDAVSFADMQLRLYVVERSINDIFERFGSDAPQLALSFPSVEAAKNKLAMSQGTYGPWRRMTFSYEVWYGDYGGTATIDLLAQSQGGQTAAMVFMYSSRRPDETDRLIKQITDSFSWESLRTAESK